MRRISVTALVLSALTGSASAQSLQVTYSPYPMSQPVYVAPQSPNPQYYVYAAPPRYVTNAAVNYAAPQPATAPAVAQSSPGGGGFLEAIFGGPTIQVPVSHIFSFSPPPALRQYQVPQVQPEPAVLTPGNPSTGQGDTSSYPIDPKYERQLVTYDGSEEPGTVVVDTPNKFLYLIEGDHKALRYGIGVGRPGFTWSGVHTVTAKKAWPDWTPPSDMLQRRPDLPRFMPGGLDNPLGARALYLGSTLYRIHGSNEPWTIGTNVSSGCIRMRNADVEDLYDRVKIGTKVVVL